MSESLNKPSIDFSSLPINEYLAKDVNFLTLLQLISDSEAFRDFSIRTGESQDFIDFLTRQIDLMKSSEILTITDGKFNIDEELTGQPSIVDASYLAQIWLVHTDDSEPHLRMVAWTTSPQKQVRKQVSQLIGSTGGKITIIPQTGKPAYI